jgi:hypothetical protein
MNKLSLVGMQRPKNIQGEFRRFEPIAPLFIYLFSRSPTRRKTCMRVDLCFIYRLLHLIII